MGDAAWEEEEIMEQLQDKKVKVGSSGAARLKRLPMAIVATTPRSPSPNRWPI